MKMNNNEVSFELMAHLGVLSSREGWTKEANVVAWNGGVPKLDLREWDSDYERMTRGITLKDEEASKLVEILKENLPGEEAFPKEGYDCSGSTEVTFRIYEHLGILSTREPLADAGPWTKEVNIVSWNGGQPKVDIRDWSPDHERMSRGLTLTRDEAVNLSGIDPSLIRANEPEPEPEPESTTETDAADEVVDRIVNYFIESPNAELEKTACDEVKVDREGGAYILPLTFNDKKIRITVEEVS